MICRIAVQTVLIGMLCLVPTGSAVQEAKVTPLLTKDLVGLAGKEAVMLTVEYAPGASSSKHRHNANTFVYVLEGEVTLVTEAGEEVFGPGDCAGFKAGDPDGHCFQNRGTQDALLLEVGTRTPGGDEVAYPGLDLRVVAGRPGFAHADGSPYPETPRKA